MKTLQEQFPYAAGTIVSEWQEVGGYITVNSDRCKHQVIGREITHLKAPDSTRISRPCPRCKEPYSSAIERNLVCEWESAIDDLRYYFQERAIDRLCSDCASL